MRPKRFSDNNEASVCYLELEKGCCEFILGSTYNAASSNTTSKDITYYDQELFKTRRKLIISRDIQIY